MSHSTPDDRQSLNLLLVAIGSHGDVLPFLALGQSLRARGHRVTIVANGYFTPLVQRLGFEIVEIGTEEEYRQVLSNPDLWHPRRGLRTIAEPLGKILEGVYQTIEERNIYGRTVVAAASNSFAARIAQEKLGVPLATINLQPAWFFSQHESPVLHPRLRNLNRWPRLVRRLAMAITNHVVDSALGPTINKFRVQKGLPAVKHLSRWWCSPQCVVGLFPEWFAAPQPDWPPSVQLSDFPMYDLADTAHVDEEVRSFVESGPKPIVFTAGSAMVHANAFVAAAVEACRRLDRRGIILAKHCEGAPALHETMRQFSFVPLSWLLPHAAALVHHGGVGTLSQALKAGTPQIVIPNAFDQPDNAARLVRLGVARQLSAGACSGRRLARELDLLLESREVARACRNCADRFQREPNLDVACRAIESLVQGEAQGELASAGAPLAARVQPSSSAAVAALSRDSEIRQADSW